MISCDFCNSTKHIKYVAYKSNVGYIKVRLCELCAEKEKNRIGKLK